MINDLDREGDTILYADDATIIAQGSNTEQVRLGAYGHLGESRPWFRTNGLRLNYAETQNLLCTLSIPNEHNGKAPQPVPGTSPLLEPTRETILCNVFEDHFYFDESGGG